MCLGDGSKRCTIQEEQESRAAARPARRTAVAKKNYMEVLSSSEEGSKAAVSEGSEFELSD